MENEHKLILEFPSKSLLQDLEMQRKYIKEMINFKSKIIDKINTDDLLFNDVEVVDEDKEVTTETEIDKNMVNTIINLNDTICSSFETLNNTYHKLAKNIEVIEKAVKYNKDSNKEVIKPDTDKKVIAPEKLLNKGNNLFGKK